MSTLLLPPAREALQQFREKNSEIKSIQQIVNIVEDEFVERYAKDYFACDVQLARRTHKTAVEIQEQAALIWANMKDAASPYLQQTLFNNIPSEFLDYLKSIPDYQRLFGSLDYLNGDHSRSIFSPAAYLADLLRFVDTQITTHTNNTIPANLTLDQRRPDLAQIKLNSANTNDIIFYIDLVIEILEALVKTRETPDAYRILHEAGYPFDLPFNLPLAEIHSYLAKLKLDLGEIYAVFEKEAQKSDGRLKPVRQAREILALSPEEYDLLATETGDETVLEDRYGAAADLANVRVFLERTGMSREELNQLVYQDLDRHEFNAGLSRLFFINNVKDGLGHLEIEQDPDNPLDPTYDTETLVNLSPAKRDRIYRFVKLARKLAWSFSDLDWVLRAFATPYRPENVLRFDDINDYVACGGISKTLVQQAFTIEAWVNPARHHINPILSKGDAADQKNHAIHFIFWVDQDGRLALYDKALFALDDQALAGLTGDALAAAKQNLAYLRSRNTLPRNEFSHVAVTVDGGSVAFYINGQQSPVINPQDKTLAPQAVGTDLEIGRELNGFCFEGMIKEVRLWNAARPPADIHRDRYRRLTGREQNLVGYWPLVETFSGRLIDYTSNANHGVLGGDVLVSQPKWQQHDLVLDPLPIVDGLEFNGIDQFMAVRNVAGFDSLTDLSIETWVRVQDSRENVIVAKGSEKSAQVQFLFGIDATDKLYFRSTGLAGLTFQSEGTVYPGDIHHVAVSFSSDVVSFFIDGEPSGARPVDPTTLTPRGTSLLVGSDFGKTYFNGLISGLRIWNKSDFGERIGTILTRPLTAAEQDDLLGYWRLDEITPATAAALPRVVAADLSANGNDLYLGGYLEDYLPTRTELLSLPNATPVKSSGTALYFDGDNDVITLRNQDNGGLGRLDRMTLGLWFKADDARYREPDGSARRQVLYLQGDAEAGLNLYLEDGTLRALAWSADYGPVDVKETVLESLPVSSGKWHHLAVVKDESKSNTYIEFRAWLDDDEFTLSRSSLPNSSLGDHQKGFPLSPVGAASLGGIDAGDDTIRFDGEYVQKADVRHTHYFAGQIAHVRLWNAAKTIDPISAARYAPPDEADETLVFSLPLDDGAGKVSIQSSQALPCLPGGFTAARQMRNVALLTYGQGRELENVYTHYAPQGRLGEVLAWQDYVYTGRLLITDADAGIGVTFLSRYPNGQDRFYCLRRYRQRPSFHLSAHPFGGHVINGSQTDSGIAPQVDAWWRFRVEVQYDATQARTLIRAKLWPDGEETPAVYAVDAYDEGANRLTAGTVGVWCFGPGEKRVDDLQVQPLAGAGQEGAVRLLDASFESYRTDENPAGWRDTSARVRYDTKIDLFGTLKIITNQALHTQSSATSVHAHYVPTGGAVDVSTWSAVVYSGRLRFEDKYSELGITFFSQYPQADKYYRLRRNKIWQKFHLASHGVKIISREGASIDLDPQPRTWYRFRVMVYYDPHHPKARGKGATEIRISLWEEGAPEPTEDQLTAIDYTYPLKNGTIGVWAGGGGPKYFDDLKILQFDPAQIQTNTPTSALQGSIVYANDFETDSEGQLPPDWLATATGSHSTPALKLFDVFAFGNKVLAPLENIGRENRHCHYAPLDGHSLEWRNYVYTGKIYVADEACGAGVTFYSRYPADEDRYYRLRRYRDRPAFHLAPHPHGLEILSGENAGAEIETQADTWYCFRIQTASDAVDATSGQLRTEIQVRVWKDGEEMPDEDQIVAYDASDIRLSSGTVGVWAGDSEAAKFDALKVYRATGSEGRMIEPEVLLEENFETALSGAKPAGWIDTDTRGRYEPDDTLFEAVEFQDNLPDWQQVDDYPLLNNPLAFHFNGDQHYLAAGGIPIAPLKTGFTVEAWVRPEVRRDNPILGHGDSLLRRTDTWLGVNDAGLPVLNWVLGNIVITAQTEPLAADKFIHVAFSIGPHTMACFVDGVSVPLIADPPDQELPTVDVLLADIAGTDIEIGRDPGGGHFQGDIQEVRLWKTARSSEQIKAARYLAPARLVQHARDELLAYWPLLKSDDNDPLVTPDLTGNGYSMRLGGLTGARTPSQESRPLHLEDGFWAPERQTLRFDSREDIIAYASENQPFANVERRTAELWFAADDIYRTDRKQVIYHEGDGDKGLLVYLYAGRLYFGGYAGSAWPGSWLATDRIGSGQWHHVALVLDSRDELRRHALQAFLDGKVVGVAPGIALTDHRFAFNLGGTDTPARYHDSDAVAVAAAADRNYFHGQLLGLRIWETARSLAQIHADREVLQYDPNASAIPILGWRGENQFGDTVGRDRLQPLGWPAIQRLPKLHLNSDTLDQLAVAKTLRERHQLTADRLVAVWGPIKHVGRQDQNTLFDSTFNTSSAQVMNTNGSPGSSGSPESSGQFAPWSPYQPPIHWNVAGTGNLTRDKELRTRLMGALRVSAQGLSDLTAVLSGGTVAEVVLNGAYLQRLYQLTQTARSLGLDSEGLRRLLGLAGVDAVGGIGDFYLLSERMTWSRRTGIDVYELDFLVNDAPGAQLTFPFNPGNVRDLADKLASQAHDFLAAPEAFASNDISQAASNAIVQFLKTTGDQATPLLSKEGAVQATYFQGKSLAELIQDPMWLATLDRLAAQLDWLSACKTALAGTPQWIPDLQNALSQAQISAAKIDLILPKLQRHSMLAANGRVLPESLSNQDLALAFKANDGLSDPGPLNDATLSNIRETLEEIHTRQQAILAPLQTAGLLNAHGVTAIYDPEAVTDVALGALFAGDAKPGPAVLAGIRSVLEQRRVIQEQIGAKLLTLRDGLDSAVRVELAELFGSDSERTQAVIDHLAATLPPHRLIALILPIAKGESIPDELTAIADGSNEPGYFYLLSKILRLTSQFEMEASEIRALLEAPELFELTRPDAVLKPTLEELDKLQAYRELRDSLAGGAEGLLALLALQAGAASQITINAISELTGWDAQQIGVLINYHGDTDADFSRVTGLYRLKSGFDIARAMGADIGFVIGLADSSELSYDFYRSQADGLLNVLKSNYSEEQWPKVYKPIHDGLALQKRDALLSVVMQRIPRDVVGRRDADLLFEYLLIDVLTGSEVETSRIQQAIAGVQLYVQRCRMNLEKGVRPESIPQAQWEWMKNYRVWEANRKVFLYPENYIEPELRDTKTPFFESLEQELMQSDIDQAAVEGAYVNYLDLFREVATLKIVGSYLHRESETDATFYLIGRTETDPRVYYYRERTQNEHGGQWLPWRKIDLAINADFVTPVYGFGKLFLFWPEFTKLKKSVQRRLSASIRKQFPVGDLNSVFSDPVTLAKINALQAALDDLRAKIRELYAFGIAGVLAAAPLVVHEKEMNAQLTAKKAQYNYQQRMRNALGQELPADEIKKLVDKKWKFDDEYYLISASTGDRVELTIDVYNTTIKYAYFNLSKQWVQPQTYVALENELTEDLYRSAAWQRIYAQQALQLVEGQGAEKPETDVQALLVNDQTHIDIQLPDMDMDMDQLTGSCWVIVKRNGDGSASGWQYEFTQEVLDLLPDDPGADIPQETLDQIAAKLIDITPTQVTAQALTHEIALLSYDEDALEISVVNKVDEIDGRTALEAEVQSIVDLLAGAEENAANGDFAQAEDNAGSAKDRSTPNTFEQAGKLHDFCEAAETAATNAQTAAKALAAEQAKDHPDQATLASLKQTADQTAATARAKTAEAHTQARIVQVLERLKPKFTTTNFKLDVNWRGQSGALTVSLPYDAWYHAALTLSRSKDAYDAELYIHTLDGDTATLSAELSGAILDPHKNVVIGRENAAAVEALAVQLAEVRIWNRKRSPDDIAADRHQRQSGQESGLFYLPLNVIPTGATAELTPVIGLNFYLPPVQLTERERIILMYGHDNTIKSLRNNLQDQSFNLSLESTNANTFYDVMLSRQAGSNIRSPKAMVHLSQTAGLSIRDFASGEPLAIVVAKPNPTPNAFERRNYLLQNLEESESSFMDVNNQPGWYVVDTGDETFLLKAMIHRQSDQALISPLPTTCDRLRIRYSDDAAKKATGAPQELSIYFTSLDEDPLISSDNHVIKFQVERLSTYGIHELSQNLFQGGIDKLLLESQDAKEFDFQKLYSPSPDRIDLANSRVTPTIDFQGVNRLYYEEIFFHIPFLIANQLNANQQFADAQRWYHYIFDPTTRDGGASQNRYWKYLPFKTFPFSENLKALLTDSEALTAYREDPFDPHAIARLRGFAYQKAVVMKYIDNLLDWGDALFSQETRESIGEAVNLYVMAYNLLGPRPKVKARRQPAAPGTYADIQENYPSHSLPDFITPQTRTNGGGGALTPNNLITTDFTVTENERFIGFWDRVKDRLFKIRHSQNLEGIFRQLALFEPAIDPGALVRAVAGGRDIGSALADLSVPVPHYRYDFMLNTAKEMVEAVIDLGAALQSALEKRDAAALDALTRRQEKVILDMTTAVKTNALEEARSEIESLKKNREIISTKHAFLSHLANQNLSPEERAALILFGVSKGIAAASTGLKLASSIAYTVPDATVGGAGIASPVAVTTYGGGNLAEALSTSADVAALIAEIIGAAGEITEKVAEYARRLQEWEHERNIAALELEEIETQIDMAELRRTMAEQELTIHTKTIEHWQQVDSFHRSKFTNQSLYNWMVGRLSGLYFQAYKLAYDLAKSAEKALQYELPTNESYISFGHWDGLKKGLLAGEALLLELNRMEKSHLEQDSRFQEIERTISMKSELPVSFLQLVSGGECEFQLGEALFDRDYPGHYFRVIKSLDISVVPTANSNGDQKQSLRATLVQMGSKALLAPDSNAVRYLLGFEDAEQPDGDTLRVNWRANQQIAISKWTQDNGMFGRFDLNFLFDDRYFPFEGTGAVSNWRLEMPQSSNPNINFAAIDDIEIHLRYTSKYDTGAFKQSVLGLLEGVGG